MNKKDYLDRLGALLSCLPKDKRAEAVSFYEEAIDDRIEEGMSEEDAVSAMGPVGITAEMILEELPAVPRAVAKTRRKSPVLLWVLAIAGSPVWVPLAAAFLIAAVAVYLCIWIVAACIWAVAAALVLALPYRGIAGVCCGAGGRGVGFMRNRPARFQPGVFGEPRPCLAFSEMGAQGDVAVQALRRMPVRWRCRSLGYWEGAFMKAVWRTVRIVACALVVAGLVLAFAGFALSGFDGRVFSATIDRGTVTLGGTVVDDTDALPVISAIAEMGRIEYGASDDEGVGEGPQAPEAPEAPEEPEGPESPKAP